MYYIPMGDRIRSHGKLKAPMEKIMGCIVFPVELSIGIHGSSQRGSILSYERFYGMCRGKTVETSPGIPWDFPWDSSGYLGLPTGCHMECIVLPMRFVELPMGYLMELVI